MNKKMVITVFVLGVVVILSFFLWEKQAFVTNKKEVIKIGIILPLTGELGNFGKTVLNGVKLRLSQAEANKEITPNSIDLIVEDSKGSPTNAVSAINKLIDIDRAKIIIGDLTSSATLAIAPIAQNKKILLISPTASNPQLTNSGEYFYRVWPSDNYDGQVAANYCFENLNLKKMSIVYLNNDYCTGLKDVFAQSFSKAGGEIVSSDSYLQEQKDFKSTILKIKGQKIDGIYIPGHPIGISTFINQVKELNLKATLFSNVAAEDKDFIEMVGKSADGLYLTAPAFDINSKDISVSNFVDAYTSAFKEKPDIHGVKGFEAMDVLIQGIKSGDIESTKMADFINNTITFDEVSGRLTFDANGDVLAPVAIKQYSGDSLKIVTIHQ